MNKPESISIRKETKKELHIRSIINEISLVDYLDAIIQKHLKKYDRENEEEKKILRDFLNEKTKS